MDVTTLYFIFAMLGVGFILLFFVALSLGHQNSIVLTRMPCPACRRHFGKKATEKAIQKAQEAAQAAKLSMSE